MKITTTRLRLPLRDRVRLCWSLYERTFRDACLGAAFVVTLLLIHSLLRPVEVPQPQLSNSLIISQPAILLMTTTPAPPLPTATPWPTAEPVTVYVEVQAPPPPAPAPEIVYVPAEAAPTMPPAYEPPPTLAPEQAAILDRQAWAEQAQQHTGGSGKMPAIDVGPIPTQGVAQATTDYLWCAGIAKSGAGRCVGR